MALQKLELSQIDYNNIPTHIAVIMDGNGRWAKNRSLPKHFGHRAGAKAAERFIKKCFSLGVKYVTLFAFSSENWQRPKQEIDALMGLLKEYLKSVLTHLVKENIRIKFIGNFAKIDPDIVKSMNELEHLSQNYENTLTIAIGYGGQLDIVSAVKKIAEKVKNEDISIEDIDETLLANNMMTSYMPDPDLFIRTGGEYRISNFIIYQLVYTELYFDNKLWPDFTEDDLIEAIKAYQLRERRYGQ